MEFNKICISCAFVQMILVHFIEFNKTRMHDVFLCRGIWSISLTLTQSEMYHVFCAKQFSLFHGL